MISEKGRHNFFLELCSHLVFIYGVSGFDIVEPAYKCDVSSFSSHVLTREGALERTGLFPWFGLIKIYLYDMGMATVALSNIVLVKDHYALGNADDIAKIPKHIFLKQSEALFFPRENKARKFRLRGYLVHPEYRTNTVNTIALVDIDPGGNNLYGILPVCQPNFQFNPLNELYTIGFTDDHDKLENFLHKMIMLPSKECKEFYKRIKLTDDEKVPAQSTCAFAQNVKSTCVWETGMPLVSNVTGTWALLGLGVHGPGCSAPSRYIKMHSYWPWILSWTGPYTAKQRTAFTLGFNKYGRRYESGHSGQSDKLLANEETTSPLPEEVQYIPAHELIYLRTNETNVTVPEEYKQPTKLFYDLTKKDMFDIDRINSTAIRIKPGWIKHGACNNNNLRLVYQDYINVTAVTRPWAAPRRWGVMRYKISLYDMKFENYTCVVFRLDCHGPMKGFLKYSVGMEDRDIFPWTPEDMIQYYPIFDPSQPKPDPSSNLKPILIETPVKEDSMHALMLYLEGLFVHEAALVVKVFGTPQRPRSEESDSDTTTTQGP